MILDIILGVLALFITATIRKLIASFVVFLVAAQFTSKCNQKGGMANPKVGMSQPWDNMAYMHDYSQY